MDAKELRIGNLVTTPMGVFKIRGLDLNESDFKASCFNPIPLTEEWLVKFGFEMTVDNWLKKNVDKFDFALNHNIELDWYESTPLTHVHQLQNLYFALTGEELEITE